MTLVERHGTLHPFTTFARFITDEEPDPETCSPASSQQPLSSSSKPDGAKASIGQSIVAIDQTRSLTRLEISLTSISGNEQQETIARL